MNRSNRKVVSMSKYNFGSSKVKAFIFDNHVLNIRTCVKRKSNIQTSAEWSSVGHCFGLGLSLSRSLSLNGESRRGQLAFCVARPK